MATTYFATNAGGGGNWNASTSWSTVSDSSATNSGTFPVAGDTAIFDSGFTHTITVNVASACATLTLTGNAGTLAFGTQTLTVSGVATLAGAMTATTGTLSVGGGVTLTATPTGSFPTLSITATQTFTSGGFTWPGKLTFASGTPTITLSGNWVNTGLATSTSAPTINHTTSETFTTNGGLAVNASTAGNSLIILGGGTWSGTSALSNNITLAGNVTVSGTVLCTTGILTYSSGTITVTGSVLKINASCTLNTNGMTWNEINVTSNSTITLTSNLQMVLFASFNITTIFSGAFDITIQLLDAGASGTNVIELVSGQTLNITNQIVHGSVFLGSITIRSVTASSAAFINYTGTLANQFLVNTIFTDIQATGNTLFNYNGNTLTRTLNIVNITAANIGGLFIQ